MKKQLLFTWLALLFTVVTFAQVIDQSNTVTSPQDNRFAVSSTQNVGQSFVAGVTGSLSQINIRGIHIMNIFTPGDIQLRLFSGKGYSGTVLNTTVFNVSSAFPLTPSEFVITLSSPIAVVAGQSYTFDLKGITGSFSIYTTAPNYANGDFYVNGGIYQFAPYDMWFKTYVTQAPATHLNFDGIDDYVQLPSAIERDLSNNVTVEFWMKSGVTPDQGDALFAYGQFGLGLSLNSNGTVQFSGLGGFQTINSTTSVTDGQWHHVAGSFSHNNFTGTNASLYIDGVLESTTTAYENGRISGSSTPATIGANSAVPGRNYNGSIEDLRIWNVARTASQISANKACELTGRETDLLAYYAFNQGKGGSDNVAISSLTDATTNVNNGILFNFSKTGTISNFLTDASLNTTSIATVTTPVNYNVGATATALTATSNGSSLVWYDVATGGKPLKSAPTPSTTTVGSTSYWVSANAKGCESARTEIVVAINPILPATHLNFDGVDDNITVPNESNFDFTNKMTVEFWMKSGVIPSQWDALIAKGDVSWRIALNANGTLNFAGNGAFGDFSTSTNVIDNVWHHVAATYDGSKAILYIDGSENKSVSGTGNIDNSNFEVTIGENAQRPGRNYTGNLDDVRFWNVARTAAEINSSKNCALQGNETGLVAYYNFNQGIGGENNTSITSLTDGKGTNNGTLNGFALNGNMSNFLAKDAPLPNLGYTFTKTNVSCNGLNDGSIAVSVYGGKAPFRFLWSNSAETSSITGLSAGTYGLISITDDNGCTLRGSDITVPLASITITEPLPLGNPTVTNPVTYNQNDTATALTATIGENGTGLVWFTTDTGGTALTTAPTPSTTTIGNTSYWVASTNANGCESGRTEIVVTVSSVAKIEIKVTATASQSKVYGAAEPVLTYTFTPSLANGDTFTGALTREAGEDVDTYAIGQGSLSAGSKYLITYAGANFSITAKPITVTAAAKTKVYGATDPSLTYSVSPSLEGTDAFTGTLSREAGENVSTYAIAQGTLSAGANYVITFVSSNFTIAAKPITITATAGQTKEYGAQDPVFTYSSSEVLLAGNSFTGSLGRVGNNNAGTYTYIKGDLSAGPNYELTVAGSTSFTITPKAINVTASAKTKVYGTTDVPLTYVVTPSLLGGDSFTGALNRVTGENAGTYAIGQGTLSAGANYAVTFVSANYTITKANQVITWNQTLVSDCGSSAPMALTATSTSGLGISFSSSNSNVATIVNNELVFVNPGSATLTASQAGDNNYNAASSIVLPIVNSQPNLIRKQFDNIIFFDNSSNQFVAYTWYKNGVVVAGQTAQYFKETGALNGSYYAVATKKDGTIIRTCPLVLSSTGVVEIITLAPNPVRSNSSYQLITNIEAAKMQNARVTVFNLLGTLVTDKVVNESTIEMVAPSVDGIYIVKLTLSNGKMFTKNLLVRN